MGEKWPSEKSWRLAQQVGFFDLKTMSILPSRCTGLATGEEVASLEYDIVHPAVLYAATTQGRVLVARVVSDGTRLDCRVLRRMPEPASAQHEAQPDSDGQLDENPAQLGVVKGHVLSADTTALRIYNTTKVQLRGGSSSIAVLTRSHFATGNADLQLGHAPLLVANPRASEGFVVLCSRDGKLIVFESLLPFVEDEWDLSQTRLPVLAGAVMLVFGKRAPNFRRFHLSGERSVVRRLPDVQEKEEADGVVIV